MSPWQGYIKMIDFGTATYLTNKKGNRTNTLIGTPHYMAPEMIKRKGYSYMVDLWAVGIMMYEFMCGGLPFGEGSEDPAEVFEEILAGDLKFPIFVSKCSIFLLKQGSEGIHMQVSKQIHGLRNLIG